jgi:hypothetical protein
MAFVYNHLFSDNCKYVGFSFNDPEERWEAGFTKGDKYAYNQAVFKHKEKYDILSLVITDDLPEKFARYIEAKLMRIKEEEDNYFNLNWQKEPIPDFGDLNVNIKPLYYMGEIAFCYLKIDGKEAYNSEDLYVENCDKIKLFFEKELEEKERELLEKEKIKKEDKKEKIESLLNDYPDMNIEIVNSLMEARTLSIKKFEDFAKYKPYRDPMDARITGELMDIIIITDGDPRHRYFYKTKNNKILAFHSNGENYDSDEDSPKIRKIMKNVKIGENFSIYIGDK